MFFLYENIDNKLLFNKMTRYNHIIFYNNNQISIIYTDIGLILETNKDIS